MKTFLKQNGSYKLNLTPYIYEKIRYMCKICNSIEWSGILFYSYKGSFEKGDLNIIAEDFFLMDVGDSGYTEYENSPEIAGYMAENPKLIHYNLGIIHSHHNMKAFFSGTDLATLKELGEKRNHIVSLIVNNAEEYCAAITRKIQLEYKNAYYNTFGNIPKKIKNKSISNLEVIEYYNLKIEYPVHQEFESLDKRFEELKDKKISNDFLHTFKVPQKFEALDKGLKELKGKKEKSSFIPKSIEYEKDPSLFNTMCNYFNDASDAEEEHLKHLCYSVGKVLNIKDMYAYYMTLEPELLKKEEDLTIIKDVNEFMDKVYDAYGYRDYKKSDNSFVKDIIGILDDFPESYTKIAELSDKLRHIKFE